MANILLLSPWNAVCGVAEMAHFLSGALRARGHKIYVVANKFAGDYYPVTCRPDDEGVDGPVERLFETGFQPIPIERTFFYGPRIQDLVVANKIGVVVINYQDFIFCNKPALNNLVSWLISQRIRVIFTFHDDCVSPTLLIPNGAKVVVPPSLDNSFPNATVIDQGIPEFPHLTDEPPQLHSDEWLLTCFGLGRNKINQLIKVVEGLNARLLRLTNDRLICLKIHTVKPEQSQEIERSACVQIEFGYLPPEQLASSLYNSHACIIWYPQIQGHSTSSAFRFAQGSRVPIVCNRSNWVSDQVGNNCWLEIDDADEAMSFKVALQALLSPAYDTYRAETTMAQHEKAKRSGWSVVAKQYEQLF